ncbi:hypothetical protein FD754_020322 [Muntiacus muntjak]|uniref:C2H2-type domain-containing protein n=1 Tax=Muntiacus muntjak TaxID=9888 RepID=A0A5N3V2L2_MUNMU|nr:hypothetical protein FD754_020322 [Muntiacus muntjak]
MRTNIPCTVRSCGKILPNSPALNMHLVKSHRLQDGIVNPTVRKYLKTAPKFYCCTIEGCPRGHDRPFSQISLVKQHFMKMHAEKKHKCSKCRNSYGTEWDLKRHAEDCGKTFQCKCGCPYASRTALYKKKKMENCLHSQNLSRKTTESLSNKPVSSTTRCSRTRNLKLQTLPAAPRYPQKLLLSKPKVALVKLPVMQFSPVPVLVLTANSWGQLCPQGVHLLPLSIGTLILSLDSEVCSLKESFPLSKVVSLVAVEPISTGSQVNLGKSPFSPSQELGNTCQKNHISSISVQTDLSYTTPQFMPSAQWASPDSSVSSCSQTDLTFGSQVSLSISIQTQTFLPSSKVTSSISAQTDAFIDASFQPGGISRETQTSGMQTLTCGDIFESVHSSFGVSTDNIISTGLVAETKSTPIINFSAPNSMLLSKNMTDNQTQTMDLLSDLENILSSNLPGQTLDNHSLLSDTNTGPDTQLPSGPIQNPAIDFDMEEFFSASNIQTQTEESELSTMTTDPVMESLDIETQTDFFLADPSAQTYSCRGDSSFLGLEMFDITDSSDTETQTDGISTAKNLPALESKVHLFLTSNETQTALDDFLLANLAWNTRESQFSSVETQTCAELHPVSNF